MSTFFCIKAHLAIVYLPEHNMGQKIDGGKWLSIKFCFGIVFFRIIWYYYKD